MRWILIVALFALTTYANQGFTTHQKLCQKGEHWIITVSAKLDKYVPNRGRPELKCVKVDEKKSKK